MTLHRTLYTILVVAALGPHCLHVPAARADAVDVARERWSLGESHAAFMILKDALRDRDQPAARALLGEFYLELSSAVAAEQELTRAIAKGGPDATDYRINLQQARLMQGKLQAVLADPPADSIKDPGKRAELLAIRGDAWLALGKRDEAGQEFERALQGVPDHPRALLGLAKLAIMRDGTAQAGRDLLERAAKTHPRDARVLQAQGELALTRGDAATAETAFTQAIEYSPVPWKLLYERALVRIELGRLDQARADLERATQYVPHFPGYNYARGLLLLKEGHPEEALAELNGYLPYRPEDPQGLYLAGLALFQLQRYQEAEEYLNRALRAAPGSFTYASLLAHARLARGDLSGTEAVLRPFAKSDDANPEVSKVLGEVMARTRRPAEAVTLLREALAARPGDTRTSVALAAALLASGDREGAQRQLRTQLAANPTDETAQIALMRLLLDAPDPEAARAQATAYLAALPESSRANTAMGLVDVARGDQEAARQAFRRALELDPGNSDAAFNLAALELRAGNPEAARALYARVLTMNPKSADAALLMTQMDVAEGHADQGLERLRTAMADNPGSVSLRLNLATGYRSVGRDLEALRTLQDAPAAAADDPRLLLARGRLALDVGQPFYAAATLETLVARQPTSALARLLLVDAYAASAQTARIEPHLSAAIRAEPDSALIAPTLRRVYLALTDLDAKSALLQRLRELPTPPAALRLLEARLSLDREDYPLAQERLEALLRDSPQERELLLLLLKAQVRGNQSEAATATAEAWLSAHPEDTQVARMRAQVLAMRGLTDAAISAYRDLLHHTPGDAASHNNLAMLLLPTDPAQAVEQARAAQQVRPDDPAILDTLGQALLAAGEAPNAVAILAQANTLAPKDPGIAFHYARALVAADRSEHARAVLQPVMGQPFPEEESARSLLLEISGRPSD